MKESGKIRIIDKVLYELSPHLKDCSLCPRQCHINRKKGERGYCGGGDKAVVYSAFVHKGEEPPLVGKSGSGTIFFSGCSMRCVYCQNYKFSHNIVGKEMTEKELAQVMLRLQKKGACNINLVTPTHFLIPIIGAIRIAFQEELKIPIVYNSSGYERVPVIADIMNIFDVFLVDLRYLDPVLAKRYSSAEDYPVINQSLLHYLYDHTANVWENGLLKKGMIIRHLVFPSHLEETRKTIKWLASNLTYAYVSILFQYRPYYKASLFTGINRPLTEEEYLSVKTWVEESCLEGWLQDYNTDETMAGVHFAPLKGKIMNG